VFVMTTSIVERMAEAICIALGDDPNREGERLTAYEEAARAALAAAREPSEGMAIAGGCVSTWTPDDDGGEYEDYVGDYRAADVWREMIDKALEEDE
jgi:hypothetical protein